MKGVVAVSFGVVLPTNIDKSELIPAFPLPGLSTYSYIIKSKNDILIMALMAIESIIRPLQKKFPEVFKDIMVVIVGTREKLKAVDRYKKEFDNKLR